MKEIEITFRSDGLDPVLLELLPYQLETIGFEGFCNTDKELIAYIPHHLFDADLLNGILKKNHLQEDIYTLSVMPEKNWNEEWEKNFNPVIIDSQCYIRAPFHKPDPSIPIEIIIEPKMSFGTGHHATTSLMAGELLHTTVKGWSVFDAGCGTGILAILAEKLGASQITGIDIDEWSYQNAIENASNNHCQKITFYLGDAADFDGKNCDLILANINLNILKAGMNRYVSMLATTGRIFMSGILSTDVTELKEEAVKNGLCFEYAKFRDNWAMVSFKKK